MEELPRVLLSYHTTPHSTTNETPFRLTFETKAFIPVEIEEPSPLPPYFNQANLDLLQEAREVAHIIEYAVKDRAAKRQEKRLLPRQFKCQDLVLRRITRTADYNKLTPNWEGPFRVIANVGRGAYRLEQLDGKKIPHTWNTTHLRLYYS
ncbi:hypothetical protein CR513_56893, partial [Mucuna pruriens]